MDKTIRAWIAEIIHQHPDLLSIALVQRAKFEGWLKFELANHAKSMEAREVLVEAPYSTSTSLERSDVSFVYNDNQCYVELKTPNSNWRMPGVANKTRPITKNIAGIVNDGIKLRNAPGLGFVAFVLFPVPHRDQRWLIYLQRISAELDLDISTDEHCERITLPISTTARADLIVCCFKV